MELAAVFASFLASTAKLLSALTVFIIFLSAFVLVEVGRIWVLATLGRRWTTRIIVVPGERLVARGPYRFVSHPNYLVVAAELLILPLVFGLWQIALLFTALNAMILTVRIRAENRAGPTGEVLGARFVVQLPEAPL